MSKLHRELTSNPLKSSIALRIEPDGSNRRLERGTEMIRYMLLFFVLMLSPVHAQVVIGFKGKGDAFDHKAFAEYVERRRATALVLSANQIDRAIEKIKSTDNYELYGYSLGADSVGRVLREVQKQNLKKPRYTVTVGAYHTTDVDFRKYNIKFDNYFDSSGTAQKSPGKHYNKMRHNEIMRHVASLYDMDILQGD